MCTSSTYTDIYLDHCPLSPRAIFCQTTVLEESNTTPTARAWLLNRLPFDARLVQSLNVKHTSIKMANTFPNRSLFYSYHHLALRTLLLRTASHCCGRWVRASKQAIQLKAWVWPEAGWNQYTEPPLHFGRQKHRAIFFFFHPSAESKNFNVFFQEAPWSLANEQIWLLTGFNNWWEPGPRWTRIDHRCWFRAFQSNGLILFSSPRRSKMLQKFFQSVFRNRVVA